MTREAVESGFEEFVDDIVETAYREFDVTAALRGGTSAGGRFVSDLLKNTRPLERHVVRPALREYKADVLSQIEPVLDYAADPDADFADYREAVLARDAYCQELRADLPAARRREVRAFLADRQRRLGDAAAPLMRTPEDEFWPAVAATLTEPAARSLVETHFAFTGPLREFPDAFAFDAEVDPGELLGGPLAGVGPTLRVDFTDEVSRVMRRAERRTIDRALREVERVYDDASGGDQSGSEAAGSS